MFSRVINTSKSMADPNVNNPNLDEDGEQDDEGLNSSVNGAPDSEDEDTLESDAKDLSPRIYGMAMTALPKSENMDLVVQYASASGPHVKRRVFMGPVTAYQIAQALLDVDMW